MANDPNDQTLQDPLLEIEPPAWTKTLGIFSIIFAALGLTCNGCGAAFPLIMGAIPMPPEMGSMPDVMKPPMMMSLVAGLSFFWSVLLLLAAIMTMRRAAVGRSLHLVWAGGSLVLLLVGVAISIQMVGAQQAWKVANADSPWAKQMGSAGMGYAMTGVSIVFGGFWPVFCLVWFGLLKKSPVWRSAFDEQP